MIQIYAVNNKNFDWNGDAVIDAISCESDITIGGSWELELEAPIDADGDFNYIQVGAVISVPSPSGDKDLLWSIYEREKSDQSVIAKARPIFMDSAKDVFLMDVRPVNMKAQQALDKMMAGTKYSGVTDITTVNTSYYIRKNLIQALASDDDNSFVNRWGGEISYENFTVHVMSRLGEDRGLRVEFGRNIESINEKENNEELATRLVPVSYNGYTLPGDKPWVDSPRINDYPIIHTRLLECKDLMLRADIEANGDNPDEPGDGNIVFDTLAELQQAMRQRCIEAFADGIDVPQMTYNVDMVDLSDKAEYQDYKDLEKVLLGDTVHCLNKRLAIQRDARVIRVRFDHIRMVNTKLTIGDFDGDYFARLQNLNKKIEQAEDDLHQLQIEFSIVNGKITSRIWQEDIDVAVDGLSAEVNDKFSVVTQTVDEISTTVGEIKTVQKDQEKLIEETKSSITQTADKIRTEVSETYSTKQETTEKVEEAQGAAEGYTDERLKSYSTTTQMQSAIEQSADSITSTVSKTYTTKVELSEAQDEAAADATSKASKALSDAKADTTNRLKSYSTTEQMNSAIKQSADSITSTVSKTYSTKAELSEAQEDAAADATSKANKALSDAKTDVTNRLKSYSTTEQMNSAIKQSADSITSTVSKTYSTKAELSDAQEDAAADATSKANKALSDAKADVTNRLKSYSTTTEMNSAIKQSADSITSTVSKTYSTKVELTEAQEDAAADATSKANKALSDAKADTAEKLKSYSTTTQMQSAIKQRADAIELEVKKKVDTDEIISSINQSAEEIKILASKIIFEGLVTANEYFKILDDGSIVAKNAEITGNITIAGGWGGLKQGEGMTVHAEGTTEVTSGILMYGSNGVDRPPFFLVTNKGMRMQGGDHTQFFVTDGRIGFNDVLVADNNVDIAWQSSNAGTTAYGMLKLTSSNQFNVGSSYFPTYFYGSNLYPKANMHFPNNVALWWEDNTGNDAYFAFLTSSNTFQLGHTSYPLRLLGSTVTCLGCVEMLYSGALSSGSISFANSHSLYIIMGYQGSSVLLTSLIIPAAALSTVQAFYRITGSGDAMTLDIHLDGLNVILSHNSGTGTVTSVYGLF